MIRLNVRHFCLVTALVITSFLGASGTTRGASFTVLPTVTMDPNGNTPLSGLVEFSTDVPTGVTLEVTDGIDLWRVHFPTISTDHALPLLGLKPDRAYSVQVLPNPPVIPLAAPVLAITGPLPTDLPLFSTEVSDPSNMEPGFTLLDCLQRTWTIAVDSRGDIVWYTTICASAMTQLATGNLLYRCRTNLCEMDMLGNVTVLAPLADPGSGLHHDLFPTSLGTYLSLSRKTVQTADYPTSETDPNAPTALTDVRDEPIVEFNPDGSVLNEWTLLDIIDPTRIGYDALFNTSLGLDWVHTNAVFYNSADDSIVVSIRHQDAVVKFARATGELIWILGNHDNWTTEFQPFLLQPVGLPFEWQWHQHAPMYTGSGTLLLFDNGNYRASPYDAKMPNTESYTRAVEFEIDEVNMEVQQVWEYGSDISPTLYAHFIGDADWLPTTGNILITFGGTSVTGGVPHVDVGMGVTATIIEVDHQTPAQKVFELYIHDPDGDNTNIYRSDRIPSLYAADVVVANLGPIASPGEVLDGLMVDRSGATEITLTWDPSCDPTGSDYVIYEGTVGDYYSHVPAFCSTGMATTKTFAPVGGDFYYLVVPTDGVDEGSYGMDSGDNDRPQEPGACFTKAFTVCP